MKYRLHNLLDKIQTVVSTQYAYNVYSLQHYVIKFVSDLPQVGGFCQVLRLIPPVKVTAPI